MAIKIQGSTIIDDSRNIVNAGIATVTKYLNVGVGGTVLYTTESGFVSIGTNSTLEINGNVSGIGFESYELDDISTSTNGVENTFAMTVNYQSVSISNPFKLMITVNGILQSAFINNTDYVFQSHFLGSNNGYTVDDSNNIKFTESVPSGSEVVIRVLPISNTPPTAKAKFYPFKPANILLGY